MTGAGDPLNNHAEEYRGKFDSLFQRSQGVGQQRVVYAMVGLGIVFLTNIVSLASSAEVWIYVALILLAGLWCLSQIKEMRSGFEQVLNHLVELGKQLSKGDDISDFLSKGRSADDESHVPESVGQLISSPRSVPAIQAVAEACFVYPASRLELLGYFRTFLVLAGLFGTVLFFGISIKDDLPGLIASNETGPFMDGLAGALACTLMGIASSGLVGVMAGIFQKELDVAVIETEAFLGEVVSPARRREGSETDPTDETELWESLRKEVERMTQKINDHFDKLTDDRVEHLQGLNEMVDTLTSLPHVKFPKGWEELATNLESFSESVTVVDKSVKALVEARVIIEGLAPAVIARDLREVQERVTELSKSGTEALDDIKTSQDKLNENLKKWEGLPTRIIDGIRDELSSWHEESMGIVRTIQHDVSDVRQAALELAPKVSRLADESSELTTKIAELSANSERVDTHVNRMGTSIDKLVEITGDLKQDAGQQSKLLSGKISDLNESSEIVGKELRDVREKLSEIWGLLRYVDELGESEDKRLDIIHRLRGIEERLEVSQRGLGKVIPELNKITERSYRPRESPDEESGSP
jgi:methyl-accepting chemotaxis protein